MKLIDNKKKVMKFWSVKATLLSAFFALLELLSGVSGAMPFLEDFFPRRIFAVLSLICALAAPFLRIIKQKSLYDANDE